MSTALVKRSLELFDDDLKADGGPKKKKKKTEDDPMLLISTNRHGVRKELKKLQKGTKKKQAGKKQTLSALEMYDYKKSVDHTEASVKALQRISRSSKKDHKTADVIFGHHQKNKGVAKKETTKKNAKGKDSSDQKTVFTDDDFKNFAKEFFS